MPTRPGSRVSRSVTAPERVSCRRIVRTRPMYATPRSGELRAPDAARCRPLDRYCPPGMQTASALDILVVDDDEPLRDMLTRSFEREGHRVTAVPDGREALARAAEQDFDVVLLDVALGAGPAGPAAPPAPRAPPPAGPGIMLTPPAREAGAPPRPPAGGGR